MSAEYKVLDYVGNALYNDIKGVGSNVFVYKVDKITPEILPCIMVKISGVDRSESTTQTNIHKFVNIELEIICGRHNEFYNIKTLYNIREQISNKIEAGAKPAEVVDFIELSATGIDFDLETQLIKQTLTYGFLTKEAG